MTGIRYFFAVAGMIAGFGLTAAEAGGEEAASAVLQSLFGKVKQIDAVSCADDSTHEFQENPAGISRVEKILGRDCRVLPREGAGKVFSYLLGKNRGLQAGKMYVLSVEYPEDAPRAFVISNKGNETNLGVATGTTVGDSLVSKYVGSNPEMVRYPLSGRYEFTKAMFQLHDATATAPDSLTRPRSETLRPRARAPKDGFWVSIGQFGASGDPMNRGAAVSRIVLYEVVDPAQATAAIHYPPADLPKRHIFWREEMGDDMVEGEDDNEYRGLKKAVTYYRYKYNLMRFLGINTFCKDMLEFGHNQGWDSAPYGGSAWYNQTPYPERWEEILDMLAKDREIFILPYYEYVGSIGQDKAKKAVGSQCRARNVNGQTKYTHIGWSGAPVGNADLADPDFIEDARRVLECTQTRFKNKAHFLGAWFRPRPEANPISFNERDIARYNRECGKSVTREALAKDPKLEKEYVGWFLLKRREWMMALRDYLRGNVNPSAGIFYTVDSSELGLGMGSFGSGVVVDDVATWKNGLREAKDAFRKDIKKNVSAARATRVLPFAKATKFPAMALTSPWPGWGEWRWDLGNPYADPQNFKQDDGLYLSYSFNRLYTVDDPDGLESFRSGDGLFMVRHYALNENNMSDFKDRDLLGYFCGQFDRGREYCMLAEARALINGDPRYLGYLAPLNMGRLFPEYVRAFNQAFLALPAVPGRRLEKPSENAAIGVREYPTARHGVYYAVVNMGLEPLKNVAVNLPARGRIVDLVSNREIPSEDGTVVLDFYPGRVYALQVSGETKR